MPPATMDAFRDHGRLRPSLEEDVAGAAAVMEALASAGISIDEITARLVDDGVRLFAEAADQLYAAVQKKRPAETVRFEPIEAVEVRLTTVRHAVRKRRCEIRNAGRVRHSPLLLDERCLCSLEFAPLR